MPSRLLERFIVLATLLASSLGSLPTAVRAQANEQFIPLLVHRTGPYAPGGTPWANGKQDYIKLINAQGGINGVRMAYEECETGYATDKGVACYERLKGKGASLFDPQSTGLALALTDLARSDGIALLTLGYGPAASQDGGVFKWSFPLMGSYWTAADILVQAIAKREGGPERLRGRKITLLYHDSPFGKEPIALLQARARMLGFTLALIPVPAPGTEQKTAWQQVRQSRPDYVLLWGWGGMNPAALKEAQAVGFARERMYGVWWAGTEPDVRGAGDGAKGYHALALNGAGLQVKVVQDILRVVHDQGLGTGPRAEVGSVLYLRGVVIQMLTVEAIRRAQEHFGKGQVMTSAQVRWGLENLNLDQKRLDALGFGGVMRPIATSCHDHMGSSWARIQTWDGRKWVMGGDWYQADERVLAPLVKEAADRYASEKKITRPTAADCPAG
ncbi:MAG: ABC transporter substrate-binding protein [Proteobacteria bacterium]|nr:ABC transporter substrate-binding protein [Pseudomonadota bacterium]